MSRVISFSWLHFFFARVLDAFSKRLDITWGDGAASLMHSMKKIVWFSILAKVVGRLI